MGVHAQETYGLAKPPRMNGRFGGSLIKFKAALPQNDAPQGNCGKKRKNAIFSMTVAQKPHSKHWGFKQSYRGTVSL